MTRTIKTFLLSAIITLIVLMFIIGVYTVTMEGKATEGRKETEIAVDYEDIMLIGKTADNAITFLSPETKAAAHLMLMVCAALSELY